MRRFDTPASPPGWAGQGAELLRIVDPVGRAIAWLAPGFGANCVGYAVRRDEPEPGRWQQILHASSPRDLRAQPLNHGCAILGPERNGDGSAHLATWRFVERDPTAATCSARCGTIRLDLTARLEDAALHLDLQATNEGPESVPIAPGLRLNFADEFHRDISPQTLEQSIILQGDEPTTQVAIAWAGGQSYQRRIVWPPGGAVALEVRHIGERTLLPAEQIRLGVIISPQ